MDSLETERVCHYSATVHHWRSPVLHQQHSHWVLCFCQGWLWGHVPLCPSPGLTSARTVFGNPTYILAGLLCLQLGAPWMNSQGAKYRELALGKGP